MAAHDIPRLLAFADTLADAARGAILPFFRNAHSIDHKGGDRFDPVTDADKAAEAAMRALIERAFPDHAILGEEYGQRAGSSAYQWVLDPIDGTRAFISGLTSWGVLIGLYHEGQPLIGIMDQPYLDERYRGWNDAANATVRGRTQTIKTRPCASLGQALASTTDPYLFHGAEAEAFARVRNAVKLTRYGYDCYAYSMIAAGYLDCVVESGLKPFDIAALIPIIRGGGGDVVSWSGGDAAQGGQVLAIGDVALKPALLELLGA